MTQIEVSKEDFFRAIGIPKSINIHPRSEADKSVWVNQQTRQEIGISTPGYKNGTGAKSRFFLETGFASERGIKKIE